jgi:hypothetical protein
MSAIDAQALAVVCITVALVVRWTLQYLMWRSHAEAERRAESIRVWHTLESDPGFVESMARAAAEREAGPFEPFRHRPEHA